MERKLYNHNSAIVGRNTNLVTVHSRVTVGGWSTECEYKLLRPFTELGGLNRARATHCRATQSVFPCNSEQNRAAVAERLLDTRKMGTY